MLISLCPKMVNTLAVLAKDAFRVKWISTSQLDSWILQITAPVPASWMDISTPVYIFKANIY